MTGVGITAKAKVSLTEVYLGGSDSMLKACLLSE